MQGDEKFHRTIMWLFRISKEKETMPPLALTTKLSEEVGEFSETVLKECGYLGHKDLKEDPIHEAADIINVLIGVLSMLYPERNPRYLTNELLEAITKKGKKYERILNDER
jgi:NTP pyrophosphatase (non-canonical NTP hydrolase)